MFRPCFHFYKLGLTFYLFIVLRYASSLPLLIPPPFLPTPSSSSSPCSSPPLPYYYYYCTTKEKANDQRRRKKFYTKNPNFLRNLFFEIKGRYLYFLIFLLIEPIKICLISSSNVSVFHFRKSQKVVNHFTLMDMTMTSWTSTLNFGGLSLTVRSHWLWCHAKF